MAEENTQEPNNKQDPNTPEENKQDPNDPIIKWGHQTPEVSISWLWKPFIPYSKVSIIQGDGGDGKTTMILDIAARLSRGIQPPALIDGKLVEQDPTDPITIFYLTNEDEVADSSLVRFKRDGGDTSRFAYSGELQHHMTLTEEELHSAISQTNAKLVIIDPFQAFLPKGASMNNIGEMRMVTTALSNVAKETGAAIVLVGHLNKNEHSKDIHRGLGSVDLSNAARSIVTVFTEKGDNFNRYMRATKSNFDEGDTKTVIHIKMDAEKKISYEIAEEKKKETLAEQTAIEEAADLLYDLLVDGPVAVKDVHEIMAEYEFSAKTAQRAKKRIGAEVKREGSKYFWELPASELSPLTNTDDGEVENGESEEGADETKDGEKQVDSWTGGQVISFPGEAPDNSPSSD